MEAWRRLLEEIAEEFSPEVLSRWVQPLKVVRFDAANLYLEAENSFQIDWFEEHLRPLIKKRLFNNNQRPIHVHLSLPSSPLKPAPKPPPSPTPPPLSPDPLDPELRFDTFLPSPANEIPLKLLSTLEKHPPFNPIYLYGPPKSGKTHLLTAAAHRLRSKGAKIFFVRGETFAEHVVQAIRLGSMQEFRKTYRDIDALLIDDLHILSKKSATQEEFFHTFNALHILGCPLLFTAPVPPSQLHEIEPRLISRFEWGISLPLHKEEPKKILTKKGELWNFSLSSEVVEFLATQFPTDPVLPLQALLLRSKGKPVTLTGVQVLLKDLIEKEAAKAPTFEEIVKTVAAHFQVSSQDLLGKGQTRQVALPRQIAMYVCRGVLKWPYQKIGEKFQRDHSTVMSSIKLVEGLVEKKSPEVLGALVGFEK